MIERLTGPPRARTVRWLLAGLGGIYFTAFLSAGVQARLLIGEQGLLPVASLVERLRHSPRAGWTDFPSLLWLWPTDAAIAAHWMVGLAVSLLLLAGLWPRACLLVLWVTYLSLAHGMQRFFGFQWDNLLLEAGLAALLLAPRGLRPWWGPSARWPQPSRLGVLVFLWLVFRLHALSGWSKILGEDPTWRDLSAMTWYFETAPLPTWVGWWAHHLPQTALRMLSLATLLGETVLPCFVFHPSRRVRRWVFGALVLFQVGVLLTASYGFFNYLSIVLCLILLEDDAPTPRSGEPQEDPGPGTAGDLSVPRWRSIAAGLAAGLLLAASLIETAGWALGPRTPAWLTNARALWRPLRSVNVYHLFASMTTVRFELTIEGTADGRTWQAWSYRWKPDEPNRRPRFVAPHQPRMDFQMWFLPLGGRPLDHPWYRNLLEGLCRRPETLAPLFAEAPFAGGGTRPRALRVRVERYRMATVETLLEEGRWWEREPRTVLGPFRCPP